MRYLKFVLIVSLPVFVGLCIRFDDYVYWKQHPQKYFVNEDIPVLTGMDGYYYALKTRRILGKWKLSRPKLHDLFSGISCGLPKLVAFFSYVMKEPPEIISVWLPPVLACTLTFPLIAFAYLLGFPIVGMISSVSALLAPVYVMRSCICWLDTDVLNLFFPSIMSFALFLFSRKNICAKITSVVLLYITSVAWKWWYGHSFLRLLWFGSVALIAVFDIIHSLLILRKNKRLSIVLSSLFSLIVLFYSLFWVSQHDIAKSAKHIYYRAATYERKSTFKINRSSLPISPVSELLKPNILELSSSVSGNIVFFALSLIGLAMMFRENIFAFVSLAPLLILGFSCFKFGIRFSMYLVPAMSLGLAFFILKMSRQVSLKLERKNGNKIFIILSCVLVLLGNYSSIFKVAEPAISPLTVSAMMRLKEVTPKNALILTWWDLGYPVRYYAGRDTFTDGGNQNPYLIYLTALVFSSKLPKNAKKFVYLMQNVKERRLFFKRLSLYKDPLPALYTLEEIPEGRRPVYIFLCDSILPRFPIILSIGMWNFSTDTSVEYMLLPMFNCNKTPRWIICGNNIKVDLYSYTAYVDGKTIPIKKAVVVKKNKEVFEKRGNPAGIVWLVVEAKGRLYSFLMDEVPFRTLFSRMFFFRGELPGFSMILDEFPSGVLYKVE